MPANQSLEQPVTLLPCPFCGAACAERHPDIGFVVWCPECKAHGPTVSYGDKTREEKWNTRTTPPSDEQEVERVSVRISELVCDDLHSRFDVQIPDSDWEAFSVKVCDIAADEIRNLSAVQDSGVIGLDPKRMDALSDYMRRNAKSASEASKILARTKSLRQEGHNPPRDDLYAWAEPEQTVEWEIADVLAALSKLEKGQ